MKWAIIVFVALCHTLDVIESRLSPKEIAEFSKFLEETSSPDKDVGEVPEDENAWENSGKFEGDMILTDEQKREILAAVSEGTSRAATTDSNKRWSNAEVKYSIREKDFTPAHIDLIINAMQYISQVSCVKFTPKENADKNYVLIQGYKPGCYSNVGYTGGQQIINYSNKHRPGRGCFLRGKLLHEMLHTLGFYHMHSSTNRDDFITIVWKNIKPGKNFNFRKHEKGFVTDYYFDYDYASVMHYGPKSFSASGQPTIIPKKSGVQIGQRTGMSELDIERVNVAYCGRISPLTTPVPLPQA